MSTTPGCSALYRLARPVLFALDPERVHELTLEGLQRAHDLGATRLLQVPLGGEPVNVMGLCFPNPVGLAAGLDKNGAHIDALGGMGFGFIEVGTVTPRAQPGNPKPRMFRLPRAEALINRLGFNNGGVEQFVANVQRARYAGILGLNIGKNAATPIENALDDYRLCLAAVYPHAGYVTINISSPNTQDLRTLQRDEQLEHLLASLTAERERLCQLHGRRVPLAVKIAPDLDLAQIDIVAEALLAHRIDGVIATNTTLSRDGVTGMPNADEAGGLSGSPLALASSKVVEALRRRLGEGFPIIGVGGIVSGSDARARRDAGAQLVQVYSGLIYRGPSLVSECAKALRS